MQLKHVKGEIIMARRDAQNAHGQVNKIRDDILQLQLVKHKDCMRFDRLRREAARERCQLADELAHAHTSIQLLEGVASPLYHIYRHLRRGVPLRKICRRRPPYYCRLSIVDDRLMWVRAGVLNRERVTTLPKRLCRARIYDGRGGGSPNKRIVISTRRRELVFDYLGEWEVHQLVRGINKMLTTH